MDILRTHHPVDTWLEYLVLEAIRLPRAQLQCVRFSTTSPFQSSHLTMLSYAQAFIALWYAQAVVAFFCEDLVCPMLTLYRAGSTAIYD